MSYNLDDIINRYHRNCQRIYNDKKQHLNIYEAGIISKVQDDFNANNIVDKNQYFQQLQVQYLMFEQQINDDIETAIINETKNFTQALASFLLLDQGDKYRVNLNPNLISTLSKIYIQPTNTTNQVHTPQSEPTMVPPINHQAATLISELGNNITGSDVSNQDEYIEQLIDEISGLIK